MPNRFSFFSSIALLCSLLAFPAVFAQGQTPKPNPKLNMDDAKLRERAMKLQRASFVVDTHNDITSPITDEGFDLGARDTSGKIQTDIPRMKEGGLNVEFFSIYVAAKYAKEGGSARRAMEMIDGVYEQVRRHPESLEMASTVADIRRIRRSGKIAALMGIEGGHAIEDSLSALRLFHRLGIRYMTLTHTNTNNWADSAGGIGNPPELRHGGLSDFGKEVIREMNRLGMMVDISHVGDETFQDVIETTEAPVIASHSSCRALTNVPRNMTDDMLRALAKNGGVIMINFYNGFINTDYAKPGDPVPTKSAQTATMDMLMAHFEHAIKVAGIDHVGIGSDFDGVDGLLPPGMEDVSKLPTITYELLKRGHSEADVKKVLGENLLRVMTENERVAKRLQATGKKPSTAKITPAAMPK
ncbi:MAG TPA: dipeptidase [Blastocatellia bacterium]